MPHCLTVQKTSIIIRKKATRTNLTDSVISSAESFMSSENRNDRRNTEDLRNMRYSPEVIRQYEDPEYAKAADLYEQKARRRKEARQRNRKQRRTLDDILDAQPKKRKAKAAAGKAGKNYSSGRKRPSFLRKIRNVLIILIILIIILLVYIGNMTTKMDKVNTDKANFAISTQAESMLKGYRNIAILGSDARMNEPLDGSRTDAIVILSISRKTGKVRMISVMRDSYLKVADSQGQLILDKITHAHHYGGGVDTCASLNRSLDLNIKEFMVFDWKSVADVVDTLDGITVNIRKNEISDMNKYGKETAENVGGTYKKITHKGKQKIDGVQAATYCRIRKTSGGDTGRGRRYKTVVAAVMKKAAVSPWKIGKLSRDVMPEIRTNMTTSQIMTVLMRTPVMKFDKSVSWPKNYYGGIVYGTWYAVPTTLSKNVTWLYKKAFNEKKYIPSGECRTISQEIINHTGLQ